MHKLKFKEGDKVRILNRKLENNTGSYPKCYKPQGYKGEICYLCKGTKDCLNMHENADGTGEYFGIYSQRNLHFNDDDLELADFVLPEKWCVRVTKENKSTLNTYMHENKGQYLYYVSSWCVGFSDRGSEAFFLKPGISDNLHTSFDKYDCAEISFEQFLTHVLKQDNMQTQKLTLGQLKDLYNESSCSDWRKRIVAYINDNVLAKDDSLITIKDVDITYAQKNANKNQLDLLKATGIKFEQKYKDGDWVTFTKDWKSPTNMSTYIKAGKTFLIKNKSGNLTVCGANIFGLVDLTKYFRPATEEEITKAKCPYKDGDLLFVKDYTGAWHLRYSNGTLDSVGSAICYTVQRKSGETSCWSKHKLANIKLPND